MSNHRWRDPVPPEPLEEGAVCEVCGAYARQFYELCIGDKPTSYTPESAPQQWANRLLKEGDRVASDHGRTDVNDLVQALRVFLEAATELKEDGELKSLSPGSDLTVYVSPKGGLKRLMERFPTLKIVIIATQSDLIDSAIPILGDIGVDTNTNTPDDDGFSDFSSGK